MNRWLALCAVLCMIASLSISCVGSEAESDLGAEPDREWGPPDHGAIDYVFGAGAQWWVSFADVVATFRLVEVTDGRRQEFVTGTVAVEQLLTLEVEEVLWVRAGGAVGELPETVTVQGEGILYRESQAQPFDPPLVPSDQLWLGPLGYMPARQEWFLFDNSVARVDDSAVVVTPDHVLTGRSVDEVEGILRATDPMDVDFAIADPFARLDAYTDASAAARVRTAPSPTPEPSDPEPVVEPCPVDADPIPDESIEECPKHLEEAGED